MGLDVLGRCGEPPRLGWKLASLLCGSKVSQILSFEDSDHVSME